MIPQDGQQRRQAMKKSPIKNQKADSDSSEVLSSSARSSSLISSSSDEIP